MTLKFESSSGVIQVSGIDGSPKNGILFIPSKCSLGKVTEIKSCAFLQNTDLKRVTIEKGITKKEAVPFSIVHLLNSSVFLKL